MPVYEMVKAVKKFRRRASRKIHAARVIAFLLKRRRRLKNIAVMRGLLLATTQIIFLAIDSQGRVEDYREVMAGEKMHGVSLLIEVSRSWS